MLYGKKSDTGIRCRADSRWNYAIPVGGTAAKVVSTGYKATNAAKEAGGVGKLLENGNNYLRIGKGRLSVGPAGKNVLNGKSGTNIPFHLHVEPKKIGIDIYNKKGKTIYSKYTGE